MAFINNLPWFGPKIKLSFNSLFYSQRCYAEKWYYKSCHYATLIFQQCHELKRHTTPHPNYQFHFPTTKDIKIHHQKLISIFAWCCKNVNFKEYHFNSRHYEAHFLWNGYIPKLTWCGILYIWQMPNDSLNLVTTVLYLVNRSHEQMLAVFLLLPSYNSYVNDFKIA